MDMVSDCCGVGPNNDLEICPACREHCEWIDLDKEEETTA